MRFLLDQSTDARLLPYLQSLGHDATRVARHHPAGLPDTQVLVIAHREQRILFTDDKDFGELVFRLQHPHAGVILLRLGGYTELSTKIDRLTFALTHYRDQLDQFLVVTRRSVR